MLDKELTGFRYYRNAVDRGWNPADIDLSDDTEVLARLQRESPGVASLLKGTLAKFGAGEEAVTEDLAPLAVVLESTEDQMFITTQMYDEAKHTEFFDRYWREVVNPAEERAGVEETSPRDGRWFPDEYDELFEREGEAMHRLLEDDSRENRAAAFCHYHMAVEGVLAGTGYWWLIQNFGEGGVAHLPGLVEGVARIRSDEGRHVGFGVNKLKGYVEDGMDASLVDSTVNPLLGLVQSSLRNAERAEVDAGELAVGSDGVVRYAAEKHSERLEQIKTSGAETPDADEMATVSD
jgi:ribonucleoside-diphosphate reductase beta chain